MGNVFGEKAGAPAWRSKPAWYQVSSGDRMIVPDNEKRLAERMNAKKVLTLDAGHASLASRPVEVAQFIAEAAAALG
jgi:pimeloyl-ACP methyl ester carboxylesterase